MLFATVRQRKIHVKQPVDVIQNGIAVDWLVVDMDDEWQDMERIVSVFTNGSTDIEKLHTFGEPILVPWEVLQQTGSLTVSFAGYVGEEKIMTTMMPDSAWNVVQNAPITGDEEFDPTPTLAQQLLALATAAEQYAESASKQPVIGANGNWYTWDVETQQYVDTGYISHGADAIVESGTAPEETNVLWRNTVDGKLYYYDGEEWQEIGSGSKDHTQLTNRSVANQHPMSAITGLLDALDSKADAEDIPTRLSELTGDSTHRVVTDAEKTTWGGKQDAISDLATIRRGATAGATAVQPETGKGLFSGSYNDLTDKPTIPDELSDLSQDSTHRTVTDAEKSTWNNKGTYSKPSAGIPKTDLAQGVRDSLDLADSALQSVPTTYRTAAAQDVIDADRVAYTAQSGKSEAQKAQARENIGAAAPDGYYGESGGVFEYATNFIGEGAATQENNIVFRPTASAMSGQSWGASHSVSGEAATIERIKGRTLVWNQLIHIHETSETKNGVTFTNNGDGSWTVNGTATATTTKIVSDGIVSTGGHKFVLVGCPSGGSESTFSLRDSWVGRAEYGNGLIYTGYEPGDYSIRIRVVEGATLNNLVYKPQLLDLTKMFGAGKEPATVKELRAMFPMDYYAYNPGELVSFGGTGLKTVGFNAYHSGTAELLGGIQYQITGAYTALSFDGETVTPSASGIFTVPKNGTLTVTGGDGTTCVHLVWSGLRNGEYEPYWERTMPLPVGTYFPDGMRSAGTVSDELTKDKAIQRIGSRAYQSGDESDSTVITDGTTTFYPLAEPVETPISTALNLTYRVDDFGTEMLLPQNTDEPVTAPMDADIVYQIDYEGQVRNNDSINITKKSMDAFITAFNASGLCTITQTWDSTNGRYSYTVTAPQQEG